MRLCVSAWPMVEARAERRWQEVPWSSRPSMPELCLDRPRAVILHTQLCVRYRNRPQKPWETSPGQPDCQSVTLLSFAWRLLGCLSQNDGSWQFSHQGLGQPVWRLQTPLLAPRSEAQVVCRGLWCALLKCTPEGQGITRVDPKTVALATLGIQ